MQISIVIPAYNAEQYLAQTVESVIAQTESNWELIIVNDGSQDGTGLLADRFAARDPRIRVWHQSNQGLPGARNQGYAHTCTDSSFLIFLDADDVWEPFALAALREALEAHPDAVAAHGIARSINERGEPRQGDNLAHAILRRKSVVNGLIISWPEDAPTTFAVLTINCCIVTAGMILLRRSALEAVRGPSGVFDPMPSLPRASLEDWDLWLRLSLRGVFVVVGEVLLNYRSHAGNLSQHKRLMFLGEVYVRRKIAALPELTDLQRHLLARGTQYWLATHQRRLAAYQQDIARQSWQQGHPVGAVRRAALGIRHYCQYLSLRHSRQVLTPDQIDALWDTEDLEGIEEDFFVSRYRN